MTQSLFEHDIPSRKDEPIEDIEITTTILYMSRPELKEFKKLAKEGIKKLWSQDFQQKGNLTDYLLYLLKQDNAEINS